MIVLFEEFLEKRLKMFSFDRRDIFVIVTARFFYLALVYSRNNFMVEFF